MMSRHVPLPRRAWRDAWERAATRAGGVAAEHVAGWATPSKSAQHETSADAEWLALRFYSYSLAEELAGLLPFDGVEPAGELGAHVLIDSSWLSASAGFQGSLDWNGTVGKAIVASAFTLGASTLTPRLELAREPLALSALPLSIGLSKQRADAVVAWRAPGVSAEGGARVERWGAGEVPGRVRNPAHDFIRANRTVLVHAYALGEVAHWFQCGFAGRALWSERSTLLLTGLSPATYTWYPASAPPRALETALVLRAAGRPVQPLELSAQLQLPLLSQELREWEQVRRAYWGTAPFEAKLAARWAVFDTTTLELDALLFARPWEHWDVLSAGAYRQGSVRVAVEQRL